MCLKNYFKYFSSKFKQFSEFVCDFTKYSYTSGSENVEKTNPYIDSYDYVETERWDNGMSNMNNMNKINVIEHMGNYFSNADGEILQKEIRQHFEKGVCVTISFKGISGLNSSFINSAFIDLLDTYSFDYITSHLFFTDTTKQINKLILERFKFEVSRGI